MYYQAISQCTQMLKNLESWLDKAEEYAGAKKFDVGKMDFLGVLSQSL